MLGNPDCPGGHAQGPAGVLGGQPDGHPQDEELTQLLRQPGEQCVEAVESTCRRDSSSGPGSGSARSGTSSVNNPPRPAARCTSATLCAAMPKTNASNGRPVPGSAAGRSTRRDTPPGLRPGPARHRRAGDRAGPGSSGPPDGVPESAARPWLRHHPPSPRPPDLSGRGRPPSGTARCAVPSPKAPHARPSQGLSPRGCVLLHPRRAAHRTSPQRKPIATACARSAAPSLRNSRRAWVLMVSSDR